MSSIRWPNIGKKKQLHNPGLNISTKLKRNLIPSVFSIFYIVLHDFFMLWKVKTVVRDLVFL